LELAKAKALALQIETSINLSVTGWKLLAPFVGEPQLREVADGKPLWLT